VSDHCLYCERPLALFSRLTGDGEFCSKEHRRIYQKEHSELALARLLQAQPAARPPGRDLGGQTEKRTPGRTEAAAAAAAAKTPKPVDPAPAGFVLHEIVMLQAHPLRVAAGPPAVESRQAPLQPRWKAFPQRLAPSAAGLVPLSLSAGAFLRRKLQPTGIHSYPGPDRDGFHATAFPTIPPRMQSLADRLLRAERVGFCPP